MATPEKSAIGGNRGEASALQSTQPGKDADRSDEEKEQKSVEEETGTQALETVGVAPEGKSLVIDDTTVSETGV